MAEENTNKKEEDEPVQVVEEVAEQLTAEQLKENLENDVKAYTKALGEAHKSLDDYNEQLVIDNQMWDILDKPGSIKRLNPLFEYEKDPKWAELQQQKQYYKIRQDRAIAEGTVKQLEDQIKSIESALESAQKKLDKFGGDEE